MKALEKRVLVCLSFLSCGVLSVPMDLARTLRPVPWHRVWRLAVYVEEHKIVRLCSRNRSDRPARKRRRSFRPPLARIGIILSINRAFRCISSVVFVVGPAVGDLLHALLRFATLSPADNQKHRRGSLHFIPEFIHMNEGGRRRRWLAFIRFLVSASCPKLSSFHSSACLCGSE